MALHRSQMTRSERMRAAEQRRQNAGRPNLTGGLSYFFGRRGDTQIGSEAPQPGIGGQQVDGETVTFGSDHRGAAHSNVAHDD